MLVGVDTSAIGSSTVFVSSETGTEVVIGSGVTSSPSSTAFSCVLPEYKSYTVCRNDCIWRKFWKCKWY